MDGTFVKAISEQVAKPETIGNVLALPQGWNAQDPNGLIKPGPVAEKLQVYSLGAVRDYLMANRDALDLSKLVVHVVSPQVVRILGPIQERARNRETYVEAQAQNLTDNFLGTWKPHDEFVIGLQTRFVPSDALAAVLRLFSNITSDAVRTSTDDGISQTVTAKAGVALKTDATVPNPITLTPFRTFREVQQPASLFALRVNSNMQAGIFEADGGAWRLKAIEAIGVWLTQELERVNVEVIA